MSPAKSRWADSTSLRTSMSFVWREAFLKRVLEMLPRQRANWLVHTSLKEIVNGFCKTFKDSSDDILRKVVVAKRCCNGFMAKTISGYIFT